MTAECEVVPTTSTLSLAEFETFWCNNTSRPEATFRALLMDMTTDPTLIAAATHGRAEALAAGSDSPPHPTERKKAMPAKTQPTPPTPLTVHHDRDHEVFCAGIGRPIQAEEVVEITPDEYADIASRSLCIFRLTPPPVLDELL